ncbi:MAG TPA: TIGR03086 family metal-binding protein [Acidimicrobiales bacterium]|nr:TIGR03086 family metal-binding protein [Acidimicrobiales bacterium]
MDDIRELHRRAAEEFARRVERIGPDDWSRPTPCTEWDVRAVVNHMAYENRWAPELVAGRTVEEVGTRFDGDLLGDDPKGAWRASMDEAIAAFAAPDALDRTVHLSFGDFPGREYLSQLTSDLAVHAWDVAKGIDGDDTLDPDVVAFVWGLWQGREELIRGSGVFGPPVEVADGADLQTRLLAFLGRDRSWTRG